MRRIIGSGFENLEGRELCAANVYVGADRTLTIVCGNERNVVVLKTSAETGMVNVRADNRTYAFDVRSYDRVFADLGGGNDTFQSDDDHNTRVLGRRGDDDVDLAGHGYNRINGGLDQDSARSKYAAFTVFVMRDGDYDRVLEPNYGHVRFVGDYFTFDAWHRYNSTENNQAYRGNDIEFTRVYVTGYEDHPTYTADVDANNGHFEDYGGVQQLAVGNPPGASPGGLRGYVPLGGHVTFVGFEEFEGEYVFQEIIVM